MTGERGLNQTLNVHGLIALRMGDYDQAEELFEKYMHLSDASRFIRESHQGYRNLGICELFLAMEFTDKKDEFCTKSINNFKKCLWCLGIDPDHLKNALQAEERRKNRDVFNTLYNYARSLIFCSHTNTTTITDILAGYNDKSILHEILGRDDWNWQCRLLALLCKAETDDTKAQKYAGDMFEIYTKKEDLIRRSRFGSQNYNENMTLVQARFPGSDLSRCRGYLPEQMEVTVSLPYDVKDLTRILQDLDAETEKVLAQSSL